MLSNVAYKPTVYKTGVEGSCPFSKSTDRGEHRKIEKKFKKKVSRWGSDQLLLYLRFVMKMYSSAFLLLTIIIIIEFNSKVLGSDNKIGQSASTDVATSKVSQFNDLLKVS